MNLKKCTINSLYYIKKEIMAIKSELEELNNLGSPVYSEMPKGNGVGDPTQKYVEKKMKLESELNRLLNTYMVKFKETNAFIQTIEDDETRLIARLRFIENLSWNKIADELSKDGKCISEFAPRKKLNRYLKKLEKINKCPKCPC